MQSLKDLGNEQVKKGNLEKAIEYYQQYVDEDHKDNAAAFTNLALCYFKLKDYRKTIQACEDSLNENRQFPKAYYRLYMTYKELPDEEYLVFINAHLFLKYFLEENQNSKAEALKIMREFKQKFIKKNISAQAKLEDDLINDLQTLGNESIRDRLMQDEPADLASHWLNYFQDRKISREDKFAKVKELIFSEYEAGIEIAYLMLNTATKYENKSYILDQIILAKKEYFEMHGIKQEKGEEIVDQQEVNQEKNEIVEQSEENLFEQPEVKDKKQEQNKQEKKILPNSSNQSPPRPISPKQSESPLPSKTNSNTGNAIKEQPANEVKSSPTKPQVEPYETIEFQFQNFLAGHKQSRDIFKDLFNIICRILRSDLPKKGKECYMIEILKKCREASMIKVSLSEREQRQIYELLSACDLESEFSMLLNVKPSWIM